MITTTADLIAVTEVEPLEKYKLRLRFNDGTVKIFDMAAYRERYQGPIFQPLWQDSAAFYDVHIEGDSIVWACGADIAPERLYELAQPVPQTA